MSASFRTFLAASWRVLPRKARRKHAARAAAAVGRPAEGAGTRQTPGTDWTRAFAVVSYEQAVEPFLRTDRLSDSERAMLMGGACAKVYGW